MLLTQKEKEEDADDGDDGKEHTYTQHGALKRKFLISKRLF